MYAESLGSIPSLSQTLCIFAAGDKWHRCVCMNIMKPYIAAMDGEKKERGERSKLAHTDTHTLTSQRRYYNNEACHFSECQLH